jgi:ATP-dependent protease HslVU (ClpYQ) peptidase subunit
MTCVVAIAECGKVVIGADSAGVSGFDLRLRADRKVFRNGAFAFGFTSSFRMGQLLRHSFSPPVLPDGADLEGFMCSTFITQVRECLKAGGYASKKEERESGGTFIVGYCGRIFTVQDDYQVEETIAPFQAVGCGESYALGALYAIHKSGKNWDIGAREQCSLALSAAEAHSAGVRGPYHFVEA